MSATIDRPEQIIVSADRPDVKAMQAQADGALKVAEAFVIDSEFTYMMAADELKDIKNKITTLTEKRMSITRPMDQAKKLVMDLFRSPLEVLERAQRQIEKAMVGYQAEQRKIAQEAQKKLDADAEIERKKLKAQADAALAEGNHAVAHTMQAAAEIVTAPVVMAQEVKVAGVSSRENYKAEVIDLLQLVQFVAANPEHIELLQANIPEINKRAKALKNAMRIPGVRVYSDTTIATRRA